MKRKALFLLFYCITLFANAANMYVTISGDDTHDGTSWESSKSSIQAAIDASSVGDTVFIAEGIYNQSIKVKDGVHVFVVMTLLLAIVIMKYILLLLMELV